MSIEIRECPHVKLEQHVSPSVQNRLVHKDQCVKCFGSPVRLAEEGSISFISDGRGWA